MTLSEELGRAAIGEAMEMVLATADCFFDNADKLDWDDDAQTLGIGVAMYNLVLGMSILMDESGIENENIDKWKEISHKRAGEGIALLKLLDEE